MHWKIIGRFTTSQTNSFKLTLKASDYEYDAAVTNRGEKNGWMHFALKYFGPMILSLSSYWRCHHGINIIIINPKNKPIDNYKTALSNEHHLSPTLAWLSVKFLWAFSLRVTFNVHNLNGLIPSWIFSFQKLLAIRHWLNGLFSNPMNTFNLFLDLYQPVWTIDDRRSQKKL